jgi:hypothetical protein
VPNFQVALQNRAYFWPCGAVKYNAIHVVKRRRIQNPSFMKIQQNPIRRSLDPLVLLALCTGLAHAVPVPIVAEADVWVSENTSLVEEVPVTPDGGSAGDSFVLHTRFSNTDRNEIIALRFNLSGINRSQITGAKLRLTNYALNSNHTLRIHGVNNGATGYNALTEVESTGTDNNWQEDAMTFSTVPGLEYDANSTTRGIRNDRVTDLGTGAIGTNTAEGAEVNISTTALKDFLVSHPDDIVTILISTDTFNSGIKRFASREATTLLAGTNPQPAGTYAPRLIIDFPGSRIPAQADIQLNEQNNSSSSGSNTQLNARYHFPSTSTAAANEIIALRFDLTGYQPADILSADLRLVNHRTNSASTLRYYGVLSGSTGYDAITATEGTFTDNDWPETSSLKFSTTPGLEYDADLSTRGIRSNLVEDLGTAVMSSADANLAVGTRVAFSSTKLIEFLKNHPDNIVTILVISETNASGQKRFASKETTVLDPAGSPELAGTYAPEINLLMANADRDGDGLLNNWEVLYGFDPDNADSNGNGIPDGAEDSDNDGLTNLQEQAMGTNPNNPDTDGDGLVDGVETKTGIWSGLNDTGTNPLLADSDGDGLLDGVETNTGVFLSPANTGTDPNLPDSDGDRYSDGAEVARNTDPNDSGSVPEGAVLTSLGGGTFALLGSDLTDPDDNIDDSTPEGNNFDWVAVTSSEKPFFGTGTVASSQSGAYDLFDNKVGSGNDKWTAGVNSLTGAHTTVEFPGTVSLTKFTIASADDRTNRDPVDWQILGSNDGINFTPIFTQTDSAGMTIWTARNQVILCELAQATPQYRYIRFLCTRTVDGPVHLNELEYFGTLTPDTEGPGELKITGFTGAPGAGNISLTWTSQPGQNYRIVYSTTLADGFPGVVAGNLPAAAASTTTTHVFPNPLPAAPKLFFRVEKP